MRAPVQRDSSLRDNRRVTLRHLHPDDFEAVATFLIDHSRRVYGVAEIDARVVRVAWDLPAFDVTRDSWATSHGGALSGYAALGAAGALTLAAGDAASGSLLLEAARVRAAERGDEALQLVVSRHDHATEAAVEAFGFERQRAVVRMWVGVDASLPAPTWPTGVSVRTYRPEDALAVHELLDRAYATWDEEYVAVAHSDWVAWMTGDPEFDPTAWFLAERDGTLVGCSLWWSSGWLKDLAVDAHERGSGLGRALAMHGLRELATRGITRVGLKVDSSNPTGAIALYESLGFAPDRTETLWVLKL